MRCVGAFPFKFRYVSWSFNSFNSILDNLIGAPYSVGQDFNCDNCKLTSLLGCPEKIGRDFYCYQNLLISLKYAPKTLVGDFYCDNNSIERLEYAPITNQYFSCSSNRLTNLLGAPQKVDVFDCDDNLLTSLEGAPKNVQKTFDGARKNLEGLHFMPEYVGGNFYCDNNPLPSNIQNTTNFAEIKIILEYEKISCITSTVS